MTSTETGTSSCFGDVYCKGAAHDRSNPQEEHRSLARASYEQQFAKDKSLRAALRALAYKWIRIILKCWANSYALR